jgi:alpha-L-fucosidase
MTGYGKVDILWLDGGQVRPPKQDIQMDRLVAMARGFQPHLIVVNRTARDAYEDYRTPEQEVPDKPLDYVWESCLTMGKQWSYKPDDEYKSTSRLIHLLVDIVSKGGNLLLNIGPGPDGRLPETAVWRLREIGEWMTVNSEAIYGTRPVAPYKEGRIALTRKANTVYAIYLAAEGEKGLPGRISLPSLRVQSGTAAQLLGSKVRLRWRTEGGVSVLDIPEPVRSAPPTQHASVFRFVM